jgi:hypothetical protein
MRGAIIQKEIKRQAADKHRPEMCSIGTFSLALEGCVDTKPVNRSPGLTACALLSGLPISVDSGFFG